MITVIIKETFEMLLPYFTKFNFNKVKYECNINRN